MSDMDDMSSSDPINLANNDSEQWEVDTVSAVEDLYHYWLGEKHTPSGTWERDERLEKTMNEAGASFLRTELSSRFNRNMHFSILKEDEIINICADTVSSVARILKYDYHLYDIRPNKIEAICGQIKDSLFIWLKIAEDGGMRKYKQEKTKTIIQKTIQQIGDGNGQ